MTAPPHTASLIDDIVAQRKLILALRARHDREQAAETRRLAALVAATKDHPDPKVNPTSAAKAMGASRGWAHQLVQKFEAGELDPAEPA